MIPSLNNSRFRRFFDMWKHLIEPIRSITDPEQRARARLLAALSLIVLMSLVPLTLFPIVFLGTSATPRQFVFVGLVGLHQIVCYFASRRGHNNGASILSIVGGTVLIFAVAIITPGEIGFRGLYYLIATVLFSSLFLSLQTTLMLCVVHVAALLVLPTFAPEIMLRELLIGPFTLYLVFSTLAIVIMRHYRQREAERRSQLEHTEQQYRDLFEASPVSLWVEDFRGIKAYMNNLHSKQVGDFRAYFAQHPEAVDECIKCLKVLDVNQASLKLYGADSKDALINAGLQISAELRRVFVEEAIAIYEGKLAFETESVGFRLDGSRLDVYLRWSVAPGYEDMSRMVVSIMDITERKRAQHALSTSEERYKIISELGSDYAFAFRVEPDNSLVQEWITDSFNRITGYDGHQIRPMYKLYHPDDENAARQHVEQVIQGETRADEYRIIVQTGEMRWVRITRRPEWDTAHKRVIRFYGMAQDITERKRTEAVLERERILLRTLVDALPDQVYFKDKRGRFIFANAATAQFVGLAEAQDIIGKSDFDFFPSSEATAYHATEQDMLRRDTRLPNQVHATLNRATGQTIWIQGTKVPLHGEEGEVIGLLGVNRDITDEKLKEIALRESEERYRIVSELISDYAYSYRVEPDGTIVSEWVTESFKRVTGYDWGESDARGVYALYHPEDERKASVHVAAVIQGETRSDEYRIITKSGETHWLRLFRRPEWDTAHTRVVRFYGVAQDITARKQAEIALSESEERYRIVSELISDYAYSYTVGEDGSIAHDWTTDSFTRITGYTAQDIGNGFNLYHPDDAEAAHQDVQKVIAGHTTSGQYRIITKDGETRWIEIYRYPIWNSAHTLVVRFYGVAKDVTERKRAEIALRESETRYRTVSELISDYAYSYIVNPDGSLKHDWTTDSFTRMTGYLPEEETQAKTIYHPDDVQRAEQDVLKTVAGETLRGEYRVLTKDGSMRWVEIRRYPVWDAAHTRVERYYGVAQDITERKQAEIALRESEARYRIVSELISDYAYAYIVTPDKQIIHEWTTDSAVRVTGYSWTEAAGTYTLYHPDDVGLVQQHIAETLEGHETEAQYRIITKSGELRWLEIHRYPVWDETEQRVMRFYGVAKDVTERMLAQQTINASQQRIQLLVQQSPLAVIEWDLDGHIINWNPAAEHTFGYSGDEMMGADLVERLVAEKDRPQVKRMMDDLVHGAKVIINVNNNVTKDGRMITCEWHNVPLIDDQGQIIALAGMAQDITERRLAEAQKIKTAIERERLGLVGRFVMAISHDFRTSLATIETSRYLIERLLDDPDKAKVYPKLDRIHQSVRHLTEQLENLNTVSSLTDLKPIPCDMNALVDSLVTEQMPQATAKHLGLTFQPGTQLPPAFANSRELERAIKHVIINAISYTPTGGSIRVRTYSTGNRVAVEVRDSGMGIATDQVNHIFDLFYRVDSSRPVESGGVGLGLSIVKMIVEAYDGDIEVRSEPGIGSIFTLTFPMVLESLPT
jgi:PAS domain S-box-containing protein